MNKVKLIVVVILSIAAGIFAYQNIAQVPVQFLGWSTLLPQALLLFTALLIGYLIGAIQMSLRSRKKRKQEKKSQEQRAGDGTVETTASRIDTKGAADEIIVPTAAHTEHSSTSETGEKL